MKYNNKTKYQRITLCKYYSINVFDVYEWEEGGEGGLEGGAG